MIDNIIEKIQKETNNSFFKILLMYIKDNFKYGVTLDEFYNYKFYKIDNKYKDSFITIKENNKLIKTSNSIKESYKVRNKNILYNIFKENITRKYMMLDDTNILEFKKFCKGKNKIVVSKINGVPREFIKLNNVSIDKLYLTLFNSNVRFIEEFLAEDSKFNKFGFNSDFTINLVILNKKIISKTIKYNRIYYNIDNGKFKNKEVPYLKDIEKLANSMFKKLGGLNYLYFEFFVTKKGIELISINDQVPILQNEESLYNGKGYKNKIVKCIGEEV